MPVLACLPMCCCRFSGNWLKLRGWEMTDLEGVLMLDGDMMVVRLRVSHDLNPSAVVQTAVLMLGRRRCTALAVGADHDR